MGRRHNNFTDAAARPRSHPTNIVRDLHETDGDGLQRAAGLDERILSGLGLEMVVRFLEGAPGLFGQQRNHARRKFGMSIEARPDRRSSQGQLLQ